jgi:osmoprotectant transport system substrate-binding protein
MRPPVRTVTALVGVAVLGLAACGSDNSGSGSTATTAAPATTAAGAATTASGAATTASGAATTASGASTTAAAGGGAITETLTVGSANFPENVLLAEIYGGALEAKGAKVTKKLNIGNRETYYKAISGGELDLLPEYTNSLLSYVERQKDPNATPKATNVAQQVDELKASLPSNLTVLTPSTAEDKDVIVCNKPTTDKYSFKTMSDLAAKSGEITLGGPPEFATRSPFGIPGLKQLYNANFKSFVPLEIGPPLVDALKANAVNCGNLFSTNSAINTNGFTALTDDKHIVPNEAVLPLINKAKATPAVSAALDAVNAKLNTDGLVKLMVEIEVDKKAEADVAKEWLTANGFTR